MDGRLVSRRALFASLIGAGAAGAAAAEQDVNVQIVPGPDRIARQPQVLSGSDIGFRVERVGRGGTPIGALVVRVDSDWVEAEMAPTLRRGTA